jgi:stage V sporulation protein G
VVILIATEGLARLPSESQVVGKSHSHRVEASDIRVGMNMQVTEVRIRPANEELVKAYASICFDDCFLVHDIRLIKGPTGLFISFPNRTQSEGGQRDIAFPVNAETRRMIEEAILAEYEKVVAGNDGSHDQGLTHRPPR